MPKKLILLAVVFFVSGCATTSESISVGYQPSQNVQQVAGAAASPQLVIVTDARATTDRVSSKSNMYGMEMAAIATTEEVPTIIRSALEGELKNRGYSLVTTNGVVVACEIFDFSNKFQTGFWSGTAIANVRLNMKVKSAEGNYIFAEMVRGEGRTEKI
jgi:uncharacterized lipoprotein YajG